MKKWKTLTSEIALDNKWFRVKKDKVELAGGDIIDDYFVWDEPKVAQVVGLTSEGKLVMVKQYKHGIGELMIEYPAGYVNAGESFEDGARREFREETGHEIKEMAFLGKIALNPTKSTGIAHLFLAKEIKRVGEQHIDHSEEIVIMELKPDEILEMIRKGDIWATGTVAATFLAFDRLGIKS